MRLVLTLCLAFLPGWVSAETLKIVTDIPPVQSLVAQVAGDRGRVSALLEPNSDPHQFQLRPSQSRELARADLIFWVGENLSPWMARAIRGLAPDTPTVAFLDTVAQQDSGDSRASDPHIWLNPDNAQAMIDQIAGTLTQIDPAGAAVYAANARAAQQRLTAISESISAQLAPVADVPFVVGHDAYGHFVDRFNLMQVGSLTDMNDTPASAKTVSKLAQMAENGQVVCVFPNAGESVQLPQVLADRGARMGAFLDPVGLTFPAGPGLYEDLLLQLADAFYRCLSR